MKYYNTVCTIYALKGTKNIKITMDVYTYIFFYIADYTR